MPADQRHDQRRDERRSSQSADSEVIRLCHGDFGLMIMRSEMKPRR